MEKKTAQEILKIIENNSPEVAASIIFADTASQFTPNAQEGEQWVRASEIITFLDNKKQGCIDDYQKSDGMEAAKNTYGLMNMAYGIVKSFVEKMDRHPAQPVGYTKGVVLQWLDTDNGLDQYAVEKVKEFLSSISPAQEGADAEKELDELAAIKDYWYNRCFLAEKFIEESPCDPDTTSDQIEAYNNWQDAVKTHHQ